MAERETGRAARPFQPLSVSELHRVATRVQERLNLAVFLELEADVEFLCVLQRLVRTEQERRRMGEA